MVFCVVNAARRVLCARAMKTVLALILFGSLTAGCSHHDKGPTGAGSAADPAMVDPTLPSWAPKSCADYHAAVVNALACAGIEQASRDQIKSSYDTANTSWHEMHDAQQSDIDKVRASCETEAQSVRAAMEGKCTAAPAGTPTGSTAP